MKQNSCAIVGEVANAPGIGFDKLDCTIESLSAGVVDSMFTVVEQTGQMSSEHLDYFFDRFQTTAHRVVGPCIKEAFGRPSVVIAPEVCERFFDAPGPTGLEIELVQSAKRNRLGAAPICIGFEPRILTT